MKSYILLIFLILLFSCEGQPPTGHQVTSETEESCGNKLKSMIRKSGFSSDLITHGNTEGVVGWDSVKIHVEKEDSNYNIQLYWINQDKRQTTLAWLSLQPRNKLFLDVTYDIEEPDTLLYSQFLTSDRMLDCYNNELSDW